MTNVPPSDDDESACPIIRKEFEQKLVELCRSFIEKKKQENFSPNDILSVVATQCLKIAVKMHSVGGPDLQNFLQMCRVAYGILGEEGKYPQGYDPDAYFPVYDRLTRKETLVPRANSYCTGVCEDDDCDVVHVVCLDKHDDAVFEVCFTQDQLRELLNKPKEAQHIPDRRHH